MSSDKLSSDHKGLEISFARIVLVEVLDERVVLGFILPSLLFEDLPHVDSHAVHDVLCTLLVWWNC